MLHVIEPATSGRAKCRGCGEKIAKGDLRLGERVPNPFADGDMTLWFHLLCGAYKRPEVLLEALGETKEAIDDREGLIAAAEFGIEHRRVPRIDGCQRAPSGRAKCRRCREPIAKDLWRIPLVFYQEGQFEKSGFVHVRCAPEYFETREILERLAHFGGEFDDAAREEIAGLLSGDD